MYRSAAVFLAAGIVLLGVLGAGGDVYRVGPGQEYALVSEVASNLAAGDVVEVTGDITDSFTLDKHGYYNNPITIRGVTKVEGGRIVRPRITLAPTTSARGSRTGIVCYGDWNVLEGLDITGAVGGGAPSHALFYNCSNLVIRNCRFHHNRAAIYSWPGARPGGNITIEFCEFDANGFQNESAAYLYASTPGAKALIQHCFFHDGTGGYFLKSRYPRNVIRYNWFEGQFHSAMKIINEYQAEWVHNLSDNLRPMHSDIVGNVFSQGWSPGPKYDILQLGGEEEAASGTEGDFNIAHNLFIVTRNSASVVRIHGNVDRLNLYNNIFLGYGISGYKVYERGVVWNDPLSKAFRETRGSPDPVIAGADNWICQKATDIPQELEGSIRGTNPVFVDLVNFDFRPAKDSSLAGAGLWPLPKGRIIDLVGEFEPQRCVPADLKPRPRRKAAPPSVGPFEVQR